MIKCIYKVCPDAKAAHPTSPITQREKERRTKEEEKKRKKEEDIHILLT